MSPSPQRASARLSTLLAAWVIVTLCLVACKETAAGSSVLPPPSGSALPPPAVPELKENQGSDKGVNATAHQGSYRGTGTLRAREKAELAPKSTGVITVITVDEGDRVKKGQLLFRVDAQQAALAVAQARAGLEATNVALANAELELKRTQLLFERGSVAPAAYDDAKSRYDAAKASTRQAEVALSQAQRSAGDTAVYAPFSGIVTQKLKSVGEMATTTPPSVVLVVQDVDVIELRSNVPERALQYLGPGAEIEVSLPGIGEKRRVPITRISPTIDVRTRTAEVIAEIPNEDGKLKPGMLVEVNFDIEPASAPAASAAQVQSGAKRK